MAIGVKRIGLRGRIREVHGFTINFKPRIADSFARASAEIGLNFGVAVSLPRDLRNAIHYRETSADTHFNFFLSFRLLVVLALGFL